jgi:hypothetical protein
MARVEYYRIDLKQMPRKYRRLELLQVTPASAWKLRKEVERFARYFRREFDYPIQEFAANEKRSYMAYLLPHCEDEVWAGACCFRPESFAHPGNGITLRWIWLHPYCRRKGILSQAWPMLREKHGDFFVEPPLSPAMLDFVLRHTQGSRFYRFYQGLSY